MFLSIPSQSVLLFLKVPAKKEHSFFFFEPRFLRIPGNPGDSCRNAQPRVAVAVGMAVGVASAVAVAVARAVARAVAVARVSAVVVEMAVVRVVGGEWW